MEPIKTRAWMMDLELFSDDPAPDSVAEQGTEVDSPEGEQPTPDFEKDREEVRQMSSFLRDFQKKATGDPDEQEPGTDPDNPAQDVTPQAKPGKPETATETPQTYKLPDGRELTVEQIIELEKGHMMQSDYTKKTQALAEERRILDEQKKQYADAIKLRQDYDRDPIGTALRLQEEAEAKGFFEPKDPAELAAEDRQRELEAKEYELQQKEYQIEQEAVYRDLENRVLALEKTYGEEFDRAKVIQFMIDEKIYSPETAWKAIRADLLEEKTQKHADELKAAKESAVNEYIKAKTTKKNAPLPVGAGSSTGSPPIQMNRPKTFEDARRAALARPYPG